MKVSLLTNNETIREKVASFLAHWQDEHAFFETRTSGSTGHPKVIRIAKEHALHSAQATIQALQLKEGAKALLALNPDTIGGKMMLVRAIIGKFDLKVVEPVANPIADLEEIIDFAAFVPMQLRTILNESPEKLTLIRTCIIGGGDVPASLQADLQQQGYTVYQTFGMTETISHIALRKVGFENETAYTLLPGISISVTNGCLEINAPSLGVHQLRTNDQVELVNDRQFIWLGRADFVINSGGFKIHPEQVEQELALSLNQRFFVAGIPDDYYGQKLVIVVEGERTAVCCLKSFYSGLSHPYFIPKAICFLPEFAEVANHKINRSQTLLKAHVTGFEEIL